LILYASFGQWNPSFGHSVDRLVCFGKTGRVIAKVQYHCRHKAQCELLHILQHHCPETESIIRILFSFNFHFHCFESLNNFNSKLLTNYYLFSSCFNIFSGSHLLPNPSTMATTTRTRTRTQTRTAAGTTRVGRPRRSTGNSVGRPRTSPRARTTGKRVGRPKRDEDYDYGSKKKSRTTQASRKQPPPDPADDDANPAGGLARAGGNDPVLARLVDDPDGNGDGGGGGSGGGSESSEATSQEGSGNDESHHNDADSIADEDDGNPAVIPFEVPGAPPVIIGRTPAEQRFSQYLAGPPFDCTDKARRVLYFQQFKSWDAVRDKVPDDLPHFEFYGDHQEL